MTTRGRVAVGAMTDLALREQYGPVTVAAIGARQRVSASHLELLFAILRRHALLKSTRGPGGGYTLGRDAGDISVADIVRAVDESDNPAAAAPRGSCLPRYDDRVSIDELWSGVCDRLLDHMQTITLKSLVDRQLACGVSIEDPRGRRAGIRPHGDAAGSAAVGASSVFTWGSYC